MDVSYQILPKERDVEVWPEMNIVGATLKEGRWAYLEVTLCVSDGNEIEGVQVDLDIQTKHPHPLSYISITVGDATDLRWAGNALSQMAIPVGWLFSDARLERWSYLFAHAIAELCNHEVHVDWKDGEDPHFNLRLYAGGFNCFLTAEFGREMALDFLDKPEEK